MRLRVGVRAAVWGVAAVAVLGALAFIARAADEPSSAPPAGIAPATVTLSQVLLRARKAIGSRSAGTLDTRVAHWKVAFGSLDGTIDEWRSGADFRIDQTLGPDHTAHGEIAGRPWHLNANGQISYGSNLHRRDDVDASALRSTASPGVTLLGEVNAPVAAYVVKVDPPGGRLEYVFFDRRTGLIDRVEELRDGRRIATTFTDYRATKGLTEAWAVHSSDGFATNDDDSTLQSLAIGDALDPSSLAIPAGGPPLLRVGATPVSVPAVVTEDRIVLPVRIGGHTVDFVMDSGADGIVIDRRIVDALGIKQYGRMTSETAGTYVESAVVLPRMTLGDLSIENAHATSLPFEQWTNDGKPIAGLLGFDFIHDAVWHVDYFNGKVEAIDPATFAPPAGAHAFAVRFDDRVPALRASIAGVPPNAFIVDTGADRSMLFSPFADAHAGVLLDRGLGEAMQSAYPFVDDLSGVGGMIEYRPLQTGPFELGPWTFPKWLFYVTQHAPAFEVEDYAGLIGQDVLRNFDLYLDYTHEKIYLVPNDRFRQRWPQG